MSRRLSIAEVKRRLELAHGDNVTIVEETYVSSDKKATFIDKEHGEWQAQVKSVLNGRRHTRNKSVAARACHLLTLEDIQSRLVSTHGGLVTLSPGQAYVHSHTKMLFRDRDYGEWKAAPYSVLGGHSHPARGRKQRLRSSKHVTVVKHWRTEEQLVCTASYELAFVNWCNHFKVDFDWQVPTETPFVTKRGNHSTYYIDAFIKDGEFANTWVELKGWLGANKGVGERKWEWFHTAHSSSQLWDVERLLSMKIIVKSSGDVKGRSHVPNPTYATS